MANRQWGPFRTAEASWKKQIHDLKALVEQL